MSTLLTSLPKITLRDYQQDGIEQLRRHIHRGTKRICFRLPTGGGKTVVASFMTSGAMARGLRVLWLAHRRELILQPSKTLDRIGVDHGIIMANHPRRRPDLQVQVASIDTVIGREIQRPDLIIVDEAHHARSDTYTEFLRRMDSPIVVGITATPCRLDGRGLGDLFDSLILGPSESELISRGYLVPDETYSWPVDASGIKVVAGDYSKSQANDLMSQKHLVGNVVETWIKRCAGRQTIVFASGIGHSRLLQRRFEAEGVRSAHLDGNTPTEERDEIIARLAAGDLDVACNFGVLTEGTDIPNVSAIINCRLTQSLSLWKQMAGRGLRSHPGKTGCIVHDHAGCATLHGRPTADVEWTLTRTADEPASKRTVLIPMDKIRVCPDCGRVIDRAEAICPCGYVFKVAEVREAPGELVKLTDHTIASPAQRRADFFHWLWEQEHLKRKDGKPYAPGYAFAKYKAAYGVSPLWSWRSEYAAEQRTRRTKGVSHG